MTENKLKTKNAKRLPSHIQFSVILSYFITSMVGTGVAYVLSQMGIDDIQSIFLFITVLCVPLIGFIFGWWMKFNYVGKQDDAQKVRVKAQFWSTMAFVMAFIVSLLMIMILLIMVENNTAMPNNVAQPIIWILSFLIMAFSVLVAYNTKKRVYRNFGL